MRIRFPSLRRRFATVVCLSIMFCLVSFATSNGQEKKLAGPLAEHTPKIKYLDTSKNVQRYKSLATQERVMMPAEIRADSVRAASARVVGEELRKTLGTRDYSIYDTLPVRVGDKWYCTNRLKYRGVPLARTSSALFVMDNQGRPLIFRWRNIPLRVNAVEPTVKVDAATALCTKTFRDVLKAEKVQTTEPNLEIWVDNERNGRLCWSVTIWNGSLKSPEAAQYWISATGDPSVIATDNLIYHEHGGTVTGTAWATSPFHPTVTLPLGNLDVKRTGGGGGTRPTGMDGRYSFIPGSGNVQMKGTLAGSYCVIQDLAGPVMAQTANGNHTAPINLEFPAANEFERAQVSAFHWTNVAHELTREILLPSHLYRMTTRVNIDSSCNAYFSGFDVSINFFRAGGGCPNTAYSDVVLHEYGHAVDFVLGGILNGGYSEGFGDALAILSTRQPCVGRDFFGVGTCLRDTRDVVLWPPSGSVHNQGRIYGGFVWQLVTELKKCHTEDKAFAIAKRVVLAAAAANPNSIDDAVRLSFVADDDDGDLTNGSPHFRELAAAADSRKIPRPADPTNARKPRFADKGCNGTHHLAVETGTGLYWHDSKRWLTTLKLYHTDGNFWYYCEKEYPNYRWAFSRKPVAAACRCRRHCHAQCQYLFPVWFKPGKDAKWSKFHYARREKPFNADAAGANSR